MKRIALYIISFALLVACVDQIEDTPQLKEAGTLQVSFAYGGNDNVKSHTFNPSSQSIDIEVKMNVEVGWMLSSDADWCVVDEDAVHHGCGTFSLAVKANDGFMDRDDATVTLSAGDFTTSMRVIQYGNVFIIDGVHHIANKGEGSTDLVVKVRDDVQWSINSPEWITTSPGTPTQENGYNTTS